MWVAYNSIISDTCTTEEIIALQKRKNNRATIYINLCNSICEFYDPNIDSIQSPWIIDDRIFIPRE